MATQIDYATQVKNKPTPITVPSVISTDYNWSWTPPTTKTLISGVASTFTFTQLPTGLNQTDSPNAHYISVTDGTQHHGFLITGVNDSAKTVIFTPDASYGSATWTARSASAGIQESIYANVGNHIYIPMGVAAIDAKRISINRLNVTLRGAGKKATTMRFTYTNADGFFSNTYGYEVHDIRFEPLNGAAQVSGSMVSLVGTTAAYNGEADITVTGCEFYTMYNSIYCQWPGGFVRVSDCLFRGIINYGLFCETTPGGYALQFVNNYSDGVYCQSTIWLGGGCAGGIISDNWMQAAPTHIAIQPSATAAVNELIISDNILDQDRLNSIAGIIVNGDGVEASSSNNIQITGNYMSSCGYSVLTQSAFNVFIKCNKFYPRFNGAPPPIAIAGGTSGRIVISDNQITSLGGAYGIQLSATSLTNCVVANNTGSALAAVTAFIGINIAGTNIQITNNVAGENFAKLINDVSSTGNGQYICRNNIAVNLPYTGVTAAGTITLPILDEAQIVGLTVSTSTITSMSGLTARAGNKVSFITSGSQIWGTSTTTDNCIAKAYTSTAAGDIITFNKFSDNLWYPNK